MGIWTRPQAQRESEATERRRELETTLSALAQRENEVTELQLELDTMRSALAPRESEAIERRRELEITRLALAQHESEVPTFGKTSTLRLLSYSRVGQERAVSLINWQLPRVV